jgi:hypothetical protein
MREVVHTGGKIKQNRQVNTKPTDLPVGAIPPKPTDLPVGFLKMAFLL